MVSDGLTSIVDEELDFRVDEIEESPPDIRNGDSEYHASTPSEKSDDVIADYCRRAKTLSNTDQIAHREMAQKIESARYEVIRACFYDAHPLAYPALYRLADYQTARQGRVSEDDSTEVAENSSEKSIALEKFSAEVDLLRTLDKKITSFGIVMT